MTKISEYPIITNPTEDDILIGTDVNSSDVTKNFSIGSIIDLIGDINQGPVGPQGNPGVQGIPGTPGAVGPAGLTWRGTWVSGTSYISNDAVSYNGASWFCILATSGTTTPNLATANWALLASQGAQGPQGVQGATGPMGPQGPGGGVSYTEESRDTSSLAIAQNPASTSSKITKNFTRAYVTSSVNNFLGLSDIGKVIGGFYVVQNKSTTLDLVVVPLDNARFLQPNGFDSQINFTLGPNRYARFTLADTNSGSDKVFMVEVINPLGENNVPQTSGFINLSATPQVLPFDINSCGFQGGIAFLPTTTEIGKQIYVFAAQNNIEIRANSANTNFMFVKFQTFIPSVTLLNKQMYRFTYIGFGSGTGGTVGGYWLAELIEIEIPTFKAFITQAGSATPVISTVSKNTTGKTFTIARQNEGVFLIEPDVAFTNAEKVFITVQNQGGYSVLNTISLSTTQIFWYTYDFNGTLDDLIDYSTITIEILP